MTEPDRLLADVQRAVEAYCDAVHDFRLTRRIR